MKDDSDKRTTELFPDDFFPKDLIITRLICKNQSLKAGKDGDKIVMKFEGYTNARFETDLSNDNYLHAAAELLLRLSENDIRLANDFIDQVLEKYSIEDLCNYNTGGKRPTVNNGNISITFSTVVDFGMECLIVEKQTLCKFIARWVLMLAKGDPWECRKAFNEAYIRIINGETGKNALTKSDSPEILDTEQVKVVTDAVNNFVGNLISKHGQMA